MPFFTYCASDAAGKVLYVGRATRKEVWRRFAEHKARSGALWHKLAASIRVYAHQDHESMRAHEDAMYWEHKPQYNKRKPGYVDALDTVEIVYSGTYEKDSLGRWHYREGE